MGYRIVSHGIIMYCTKYKPSQRALLLVLLLLLLQSVVMETESLIDGFCISLGVTFWCGDS